MYIHVCIRVLCIAEQCATNIVKKVWRLNELQKGGTSVLGELQHRTRTIGTPSGFRVAFEFRV